MAYTCFVIGCSNSIRKLKKWRQEICNIHNVNRMEEPCDCVEPFRLIPFPTEKKNKNLREQWKKMINRRDENYPNIFKEPSKDSRVCSKHFVDGEPSTDNPLPSLHLGYASNRKFDLILPPGYKTRLKTTAKMENFRKTSRLKKQKKQEEKATKKEKTQERSEYSFNEQVLLPVFEADTENVNAIEEDLDISFNIAESRKQLTVMNIFVLIVTLVASCHHLLKIILEKEQKILELEKEIKKIKSPYESLLNKKNCCFYTNLSSVELFNKLHDFIAPRVKRRFKGQSPPARQFIKTPEKMGPSRKLASQNEFLLVLMKLRLGLFNRDLSDRFHVSMGTISNIFSSWIKAMSMCLKPLIYIPDQGVLNITSPSRYHSFKNLSAIIDCSKVFIETLKNHEFQSSTWSSYKHHNTIKFLVAVAPNSSILYVSPFYTGKISDKALTIDCGYLDLISPYCSIMADKGFNLFDECASRNIHFIVPPGKRGASQMTPNEIIKTSSIAKVRILVEQVIRRVKTFQLLGNEMSLSLLCNADDILIVGCALCNFMKPIYDE